ncbi:unnamed protein product [Spirodela intermedia]|uniref:Uncharacterized protein n=1 Tax=Spirodela intermedia TaxID=51605 RepID=A0A7I8L0S3_SPIIN|nr:unnamed protein product [Spirodela intermedia]
MAEVAAAEEDGEGEEDCFFESLGRISSSVSFDIGGLGSSSSDTDIDDARTSFASAVGPPAEFLRHYSFASSPIASPSSSIDGTPGEEDYGIWMGEPLSVQERRRRLLQGMGLASWRDFGSAREGRGKRRGAVDESGPLGLLQPPVSSVDATPASASNMSSRSTIVRSKSDVGEAAGRATIWRFSHLIGSPLPSCSLVRSVSTPPSFSFSPPASEEDECDGRIISVWRISGERDLQISNSRDIGDNSRPRLYTIKNLDTGKEFVIDELLEDGTWNRLSDPQTGMRLTIEEFETTLGYSPIVRELMRRANIASMGSGSATVMSSLTHGRRNVKSSGKKKGIGWFKNIRGVASSVTALMLEKEREIGSSGRCASSSTVDSSSSEWMKVRQSRKPYKELTGLYLCQEIRAHQGSIWTIKFSLDSRLLASAGEDRVIHVWQVIECDDHASSSRRIQDEAKSAPPSGYSLDQSTRMSSPDQSNLLDVREAQRLSTKISSHRKRSSIPDYVVPGTVFSLSQKPICSFHGHLDDVLDLSWSKSQYLLSSSMDKTVRLWDMASKTCLKMFAHNDYVTCIQFNPVDDRYFISGSLDAKVRIWNIPDRQVVDWTDLHEMVTAACYTPDGQGALVGSHKGTCRFYSTSDGKLHQRAQTEIQNKRRKSHAKKITGFQFVPGNPSEVLVTSADSQIRIFDGIQLTHKFRGFRNTSSQMSASCTADGNYVICASEDSNVYVWKREEPRSAGSMGKGKTWITTRSHEHFHCKDVSVAIPWPPSSNNKIEPPLLSSCLRQHGHQLPLRSPGSQQPLSSIITAAEDVSVSSRMSPGPPLAKKHSLEQTPPCLEEDLSNPSHSGPLSGGSSSSFSTSSWLMSGALSSISALNTFTSSSLPSLRWHSGSNNRSTNGPSSTAWGLVVVTAGLGGEIKIFQNFGLPRLLNRQNNIF